jgi:DNA-binding response OmpR family regulator
MRILIADDDAVSRILLEAWLAEWGYDVLTLEDGGAAWQALQLPGAPRIAILDWMMPTMTGPEICRALRAQAPTRPRYVILVTAKNRPEDIIDGLEAGADDYLSKGFNPQELRARIHVGERVLKLQSDLATRVVELETALAHVQQLEGLIPICAYCKKVRDDQDYWQQVEIYIMRHSRAQFSHGICPECYQQVLRELE